MLHVKNLVRKTREKRDHAVKRRGGQARASAGIREREGEREREREGKREREGMRELLRSSLQIFSGAEYFKL